MSIHNIEKIDFEGDTMLLLVDGKSYRISLVQVSERLATASDAQRRSFRMSPSGYGIHWPEIDEDLSIDGLISTTTTYRSTSAATVLREDKTDFKK
jgi:hypothetical protein